MTIEIRVPQLPESVADATLVAWHKKPGDPISRDENLADLETDKVVLEVPAPTHGVVDEIKVQSGTTVTSGQVLAIIREGPAQATGGDGAAAKKAAASAAPAQAAPAAAAKAAPSAPIARDDDTGTGGPHGDKLSPSVRRLVEENQLDPGRIPASGRDGRIT